MYAHEVLLTQPQPQEGRWSIPQTKWHSTEFKLSTQKNSN